MKKLKLKGKRNGRFSRKTLDLKLDLGCGPNKKEGFYGVDQFDFPGVDRVMNLVRRIIPGSNGPFMPWPWKDNSVSEAHSSHFVEHLTRPERCHFFNELWRVMKVGAKATIICPHCFSCRAYGDPTHEWPPMSEFMLFYLNRTWREKNAPHTDKERLPWGYNCHFDMTWGFSLEPGVAMKNQEYQQHAMTYFKEACQDLIGNLTKAELPEIAKPKR